MSNNQKFLILILVVLLLVALFIIVSKLKLKKKTNKSPEAIKTYAEIKEEEKPLEVEKPKTINKTLNREEISSNDFESFIEHKRNNTIKPKRIELPADFKDVSMPYMPRRRQYEKKPKSVAEEIKSLSPELKAMIIAGVLDKRGYE